MRARRGALAAAAAQTTPVDVFVGMERTHLYRKLRSLGIDPKRIKDEGRE